MLGSGTLLPPSFHLCGRRRCELQVPFWDISSSVSDSSDFPVPPTLLSIDAEGPSPTRGPGPLPRHVSKYDSSPWRHPTMIFESLVLTGSLQEHLSFLLVVKAS